eukprot:747898-Hanusia_phi.AAC.2
MGSESATESTSAASEPLSATRDWISAPESTAAEPRGDRVRRSPIGLRANGGAASAAPTLLAHLAQGTKDPYPQARAAAPGSELLLRCGGIDPMRFFPEMMRHFGFSSTWTRTPSTPLLSPHPSPPSSPD